MIFLSRKQICELLDLPTFEEWEKMNEEERDKLIKERRKERKTIYLNNEQLSTFEERSGKCQN